MMNFPHFIYVVILIGHCQIFRTVNGQIFHAADYVDALVRYYEVEFDTNDFKYSGVLQIDQEAVLNYNATEIKKISALSAFERPPATINLGTTPSPTFSATIGYTFMQLNVDLELIGVNDTFIKAPSVVQFSNVGMEITFSLINDTCNGGARITNTGFAGPYFGGIAQEIDPSFTAQIPIRTRLEVRYVTELNRVYIYTMGFALTKYASLINPNYFVKTN